MKNSTLVGNLKVFGFFDQIEIDLFGSRASYVFHFANSANMVSIVSIVKKQFRVVCKLYVTALPTLWKGRQPNKRN